MKKIFSVRNICINALIAALYILLTIISGPLAFAGGSFQLRLSEILIFFVFFNPTYSIGIILGCFISNMLSMYGILDLLIGTLATIVSCFLIYVFSKLIKSLFLCGVINVFSNAIIVPFVFMIYDQSLMNFNTYIILALWTLLSELCVTLIGYALFLLVFKKTKNIHKIIGSTQNEDFKW